MLKAELIKTDLRNLRTSEIFLFISSGTQAVLWVVLWVKTRILAEFM